MSNNEKQDTVFVIYNGARIEVSREVADYLEECKRDMHRQRMKKQRNISEIQFEEGSIEDLMAVAPVGFVDELIRNMDKKRLPALIALLPEIQRRRLVAYFYERLTYREIAKREGVEHQAILRSVESAVKKLKNFFK